MELVVLHDVENARHCVQSGLHQGRALVSTHPAVEVYLKERHQIDCRSIGDFLEDSEIARLRDLSSAAVDRILEELDSRIAPALGRQMGVPMRFFVPLYSYLGKYHFSAYSFFAEAFRKVLRQMRPQRIYLYDRRFDTFLDTQSDMRSVARRLFPEASVEIVDSQAPGSTRDRRIVQILKKAFSRRLLGFLRRLWHRFSIRWTLRRSRPGRQTILMYEDLYDLSFLPKQLGSYNLVYYERDQDVPVGSADTSWSGRWGPPEGPSKIKDGDLVGEIFVKDVLEDFSHHVEGYGNAVASLKKIHEDRPISLGIWGCPPVERTKALIFEFLRANHVRVAGAQHGGVYGESYKPWHFDSDFSRCDYFMSYGFTQDDLRRLYPDKRPGAEIVPVGSAKTLRSRRHQGTFDFLVPLSPIKSMFDGWWTNGPPQMWAQRQARLLRFLNDLVGQRVCVKLLINSTQNNCAVLPMLEKLPNLRVITDMHLMDFLERYRVRAVILDAPSTPLYEVLPLDAEIFLMNDRIQPFEAQALAALRRRVHYTEDEDELIALISSFLKGNLPPKRDSSFYDRYVHRSGTERRVVELIDQWTRIS